MSKVIDYDRLIPVWETTSNVIAAWVFGSAQDGVVGAESDIDIGILIESPLSLDEKLELLGRLQASLQFEKVELIILNDAGPILRFKAVSGRPLYCRDLNQRAGFVSLTAREYEDEMAQWEKAMRDHQLI
jgi:predicted nucleotidyltransferase